jgi:sporulation protein YlmC with PRC-barrel domain
MNVPLNATVTCTDGPCGKTTNVVVNPVTHTVTHIVVEDKSLPGNATRLVPVANVASTSGQSVTLNCAKAEVAKMPPFAVTDFVQQTPSGMAYSTGDVYSSQYVFDDTGYSAVAAENLPKDELALYTGMKIEASDGKVGKLDALVMDPDSGAISNVMMREGHLWGKKDVTIPISAIEFADGDTIYLKLDKEAVKALPAVPVKHPRS